MGSIRAGGDTENTGRRRGGRERKRGAVASGKRAFKQPVKTFQPVDLVSADGVERIHNASLKVLAETGINVLHDEARQVMKVAGADVKEGETRVHFDPDLILEKLSTVPSQFTLHARNPEHNLTIGGDRMTFCLMASAPNSSCLDRGRRSGNHEDYRNFLKIGQHHSIVHALGGYPVEPVDIHPSIRHLDCISDYITLTDKAYNVYSLGKERIADAIEMTRIAHGLTTDQLRRQPSVFTIINTNSPLQLDIPMMQGIMDMSSMGQPVVITPFTLSGAMAPVTIPGALVLQNAEALAGLAFSQMVNPGAPAMYGGFTSNVDMKSGSPAFGTPEYMKAQHVGGQLARRYNIPYRTSNVCAANTVDAQAAYESVFSLWGAVNSGGHLLKHGAGWMEGGLCCSYEKMILDIDLLQMVAEFMEPLNFDEEELGLEAIAEVGPGGHFFGTPHTQARFKDAFYSPILSDWRNFETWFEAGEPTAMQKANQVWKQCLADYQAPPLDVAIAQELSEFVERRKREGGVPTDF